MGINLQFREDLDVLEIKGYSTFPKAPTLEPHHQMLLRVMLETI